MVASLTDTQTTEHDGSGPPAGGTAIARVVTVPRVSVAAIAPIRNRFMRR